MLELEGGYTLHHNRGEHTHTYAGIYRAANPSWLGWEYIDKGDAVPEYLVLDFYEENYWDKVNGDELPEGLDLLVFSLAVNAGVHQASKLLQRVLNAEEDGIIGSRTVAKAQEYSLSLVGEQVVRDKWMDYTCETLKYYNKVVVKDKTKEMFLKGWINRAIKLDRRAMEITIPF